MARVFTIVFLTMIFLKAVFSLPIINPNLILTYHPVWDTPNVNKVCFPLSERRQELSKSEFKEYVCFCMKTSDDTKRYAESTYNSIKWLKRTDIPLSRRLLETLSDILNYLQTEFDKQDIIFQFLEGKPPTNLLADPDPITRFVIENALLNLDQFYPKYFAFLEEHLLERYKNNFKKLKMINMPRLLRNELDYARCYFERTYSDGDFKTMAAAIRLINRKMVDAFYSMVYLDNLNKFI